MQFTFILTNPTTGEVKVGLSTALTIEDAKRKIEAGLLHREPDFQILVLEPFALGDVTVIYESPGD